MEQERESSQCGHVPLQISEGMLQTSCMGYGDAALGCARVRAGVWLDRPKFQKGMQRLGCSSVLWLSLMYFLGLDVFPRAARRGIGDTIMGYGVQSLDDPCTVRGCATANPGHSCALRSFKGGPVHWTSDVQAKPSSPHATRQPTCCLTIRDALRGRPCTASCTRTRS